MQIEYNGIQYPKTIHFSLSENVEEIHFHFTDGSTTIINATVFEQMILFLEFLTHHDQSLCYLINSADKIKEKLDETSI